MTPQAIAHYRINAKLGAGGMGEVYRATDTKLGREVAIKIIPDTFARDSDRLARFTREAQVLASLNHPNIAAIYGVEERALVMELVEGESLQGPMPFDDAWKIASQIAAALEYAHERGIVHRDLKPANIKVTPDGIVKLLDFGLAKALSDQPGAAGSVENSPTLTMNATQLGVILGTAAYMAPEQAKGKIVDKRADIWAFGVVLYELLTGERLFEGEDVSDTLAQVLTKQPDLDRVPVKARRLLGECLQKDPKLRLRDIGDAGRLLDEKPMPAASQPPRFNYGWLTAAVMAVVTLGLGFFAFRRTPPERQTLRYTIATPENTTSIHSLAISPDGHLVAIAAAVNGKRQLWLRALDALQGQLMPGTEDATNPFWSPDSRYIGFFAEGKLKKIAASGGPPQSLCPAPTGRGGSWNRDGIIVFSPDAGAALQRVSVDGGVPADVIRNEGMAHFPIFLPDGRHFLYVLSQSSPDRKGVYRASLDGKENLRILADDSSVAFAAGRLLFIRDNTLLTQSFNDASGRLTGEVLPVAEGVSYSLNNIYVTASETGVLLYESGGLGGGENNQMAWYDRGGRLLGAVGAPGRVFDPAISPDEKSVAFQRGADVWLRDLARGAEQRLTADGSINSVPFWAPDGGRVAFNSNRGEGVFNLYQKAANGSGKDELLLATPYNKGVDQWSRDGQFVVYSQADPRTKNDIWVLPMNGSAERKPVPVVRSEFDELFGQLSPDSHWIAYTSDESGQREVYVRPFPASEGQWRISITGGEQPRWRGDGKELFFVSADNKMMAVAVKAAVGPPASFEPGTPQALFEAHLTQGPVNTLFQYDVTADGKRFLLDSAGAGGSPPLTVVVNWDAGLNK